MKIDQPDQDLISRGVAEVVDQHHLETKLRRGRTLRIKFGIDPTSYRLHLGHIVPLRKLRAWQLAGHHAVLIIGDYTAQVGDPSGRDQTRTALSSTQTRKFAANYLDQVSRVIDLRKTEVRYNSEWFNRFSAADFLKLMTTVGANKLLSHETFRRRLDRGQPLGLHELMYPLLQGYDSVAIKADVELGGMDQKFSLLTGRDVQAAYGQDRQDIMLFDYLPGTDGKKKMSKTEKNTIDLEDPPAEMYGKIMSIPDKAVPIYFNLATDEPPKEVAEIGRQLRRQAVNPRDLKSKLAKTVVAIYYGDQAATAAEFEFTHIFRKGGHPHDMQTVTVRPGEHSILNLLVSNNLAASRSEARRLVEQGGVKIDRKTITDWEQPVVAVNGAVLQVGKRKFVKFEVQE